MTITETQIVAAAEAFIERHKLSLFTWMDGEIFPKPTLSMLIAFEEEMRLMRAAATAADSAVKEPADAKPCADGHVWSNQFGDDWTPDDGMSCDCHQRLWAGKYRPSIPNPSLAAEGQLEWRVGSAGAGYRIESVKHFVTLAEAQAALIEAASSATPGEDQ